MSKIGSNNFSVRVGNNIVNTIYFGARLVYSAISSIFEYSYKIMGLTYITKVENSIYDIYYDV